MKRTAITLAAALLVLLSCILPVCAAGNRLVDDAGLLNASEASRVRDHLDTVSERHGVEVVVVTTDSTYGSNPREYADDYFDYNGYGEDGILFLVSMEDRDWWISTAGYGIVAFTDAGLDYISDQVVPLLSEEEYEEAFATFATLCDSFLERAETGKPYDNFDLPKSPFQPGKVLLICLVIGLAAAGVATIVMRGQLKSVHRKAGAGDYLVPGSLKIRYSRDFLLYTTRSRREKPKSTSGSSTHSSSSGRSHGGRGGKF